MEPKYAFIWAVVCVCLAYYFFIKNKMFRGVIFALTAMCLSLFGLAARILEHWNL